MFGLSTVQFKILSVTPPWLCIGESDVLTSCSHSIAQQAKPAVVLIISASVQALAILNTSSLKPNCWLAGEGYVILTLWLLPGSGSSSEGES